MNGREFNWSEICENHGLKGGWLVSRDLVAISECLDLSVSIFTVMFLKSTETDD